MRNPIRPVLLLVGCLPLCACLSLRPAEPSWAQVNADYHQLFPNCSGGAAADLQTQRIDRRHVRVTWNLFCHGSDAGVAMDLDYEWTGGHWHAKQLDGN